MRTYQTRFSLGQDDDGSLREYAAVFSQALRSLHASRHAGNALPKPAFMREFGLTSRQYNAVRFSLDGMESSIVESRPTGVLRYEQNDFAGLLVGGGDLLDVDRDGSPGR